MRREAHTAHGKLAEHGDALMRGKRMKGGAHRPNTPNEVDTGITRAQGERSVEGDSGN
jgi:hypothetical protein